MIGKDRVEKYRVGKVREGKDKIRKDWVVTHRIGKDRVRNDRVGKDRERKNITTYFGRKLAYKIVPALGLIKEANKSLGTFIICSISTVQGERVKV